MGKIFSRILPAYLMIMLALAGIVSCGEKTVYKEGEIFIFGSEPETEIESKIEGVYHDLADFEYRQLLLEKIRITHEDFYGNPVPEIDQYSKFVLSAWDSAYDVIIATNSIIPVVQSYDDIDISKQRGYINELKALRCMVYYNLAMLWENVPYFETNGPDNTANPKAQILSSESIYDKIDNEILKDIDILPEGEHRISLETIKALRSEIALAQGDRELAKTLLGGCGSDFRLSIDRAFNLEAYNAIGGVIDNYTAAKVSLLLQEANMADGSETAALDEAWKAKKQDWGYWPMLKRTGQARAMSGCEEHELLFPIPVEAQDIYHLTQNPGY